MCVVIVFRPVDRQELRTWDIVQAPDKDIPAHRIIEPPVLSFGTPVVLITTLDPGGTSNISPVSSAWALNDRVVLGMATDGQGSENAVREGECVVNFAPSCLWEKVERLARATGRHPVPAYEVAGGYHHGPAKFEAVELTPLPSDIARPPRIAECPFPLEARIIARIIARMIAAHAPGGGAWEIGCKHSFAIIETQVLRVHAHEDVAIPDTAYVNVTRWQPLLYVFRHYLEAGRDLGRAFRATF